MLGPRSVTIRSEISYCQVRDWLPFSFLAVLGHSELILNFCKNDGGGGRGGGGPKFVYPKFTTYLYLSALSYIHLHENANINILCKKVRLFISLYMQHLIFNQALEKLGVGARGIGEGVRAPRMQHLKYTFLLKLLGFGWKENTVYVILHKMEILIWLTL